MTNRDFLKTIAADETLFVELREHAEKELKRIDAANEKAAEKRKEKDAENQPLIDALVAALTDEPQTASDLMGVIECSVQRTSSLLRKAVVQGIAKVQDVKVPKKGPQKGYTKI